MAIFFAVSSSDFLLLAVNRVEVLQEGLSVSSCEAALATFVAAVCSPGRKNRINGKSGFGREYALCTKIVLMHLTSLLQCSRLKETQHSPLPETGI